MRKFLLLLVALQLLSGCVSKRDLGGVATVTLLLVAVPLVPFSEAYHLINDTEGKAQEKLKLWREGFDPIYTERINIIMSRDPTLDAEIKFHEKNIAFFPTERSSELYIGMHWGKYEIDGEQNQKVIDSDQFLTNMQLLFANDPTHEKVAGYKYHSPIYCRFEEKAFAYRAAFNQKMSELSGLYSPNTSNKPISTKCPHDIDKRI